MKSRVVFSGTKQQQHSYHHQHHACDTPELFFGKLDVDAAPNEGSHDYGRGHGKGRPQAHVCDKAAYDV